VDLHACLCVHVHGHALAAANSKACWRSQMCGILLHIHKRTYIPKPEELICASQAQSSRVIQSSCTHSFSIRAYACMGCIYTSIGLLQCTGCTYLVDWCERSTCDGAVIVYMRGRVRVFLKRQPPPRARRRRVNDAPACVHMHVHMCVYMLVCVNALHADCDCVCQAHVSMHATIARIANAVVVTAVTVHVWWPLAMGNNARGQHIQDISSKNMKNHH
jgi:hypothetical protein